MQNQKDDYRNKNKELSKLKLILAFNFPVRMEEHFGWACKDNAEQAASFPGWTGVAFRRETFASERLHGRSGW